MAAAVAIIAVLCVIYSLLAGAYKEHRMSEQAAKVLRQAAEAEETYFGKHQKYFDAEVSGNGEEDVFLTAPGGEKTSVRIPRRAVLSIKARGKDKSAFVGRSFCVGSKVLHRYDSRTGKMSTSRRVQDEAG